ncbi:MAG: flagellar biosynthesis anti-sigma factor FlgM [Limnohabitans sp.]
MTDAISNYGQRAQSDASLRSALDKVNRKNGSSSSAPAEAPASTSSAKAPGPDELHLSNVAARAMAEPDFDRAKVESIKQAIQDGQYPLNPRKIAESFHAIEQMIRE